MFMQYSAMTSVSVTVILSVLGLYRVSIFSGHCWLSLPAATGKRMWVNISVDMACMISDPKLSDKLC